MNFRCLKVFWSCIILLSAFGISPVAAQQTVPPRRVEFLDSAYQVLGSAAGARYRRETEPADSVGGTLKIYNQASGKLVTQQGYAHLRKGVLQGVWENWYPTGQLHMHQEFALGRRVGELRTYYPSGQLKRRETYNLKDDFSSSGECFAENGQAIPFFKYEQMPAYPEGDGGNRVIIRAIQRAVKYPKEAIKANCAGRVVVAFNVTAQGEVADSRVVQGLCPSLDAAVLQAVQQLKRFRPGQQDGLPVSVAFTIPITFALL